MRSRKSKDRQYNGIKENDQRGNQKPYIGEETIPWY